MNMIYNNVCRMLAVLAVALSSAVHTQGQQTGELRLTLDRTIAIAADSSLEAFRSKNMYLASYWQYRTYKAGRLPSLTLNLTPAEYYRDITRRYDSGSDIDVYRRQQSFYAYGGLEVAQNFDLLGGTFFLNTNMSYMRNFGDNTYTQFTSVPVRIGYTQNLVGYNPFKWERKIEPLKYEQAKRQLLYSMEQTSEQATAYFFDLAMAQAEYDMAVANVSSTDTLYRTGEQRQKIASITQSELLTLKIDAVNARNTLRNAEIELKRAMSALASYLNLDKNTAIRLELPRTVTNRTVSVDEALAQAASNNPRFLELSSQIMAAEREVDRTRKEAMFNASLRASIGFNQVAATLADAYRNPVQQEVVSIGVSIPLVDWGVRKGKYNIARNNLNVTQISARQEETRLEEDLVMTVGDFNIRRQLVESAEEVVEISRIAYSETRQRFMTGKADINSLTLSYNRMQTAERNYITELRNYRLSYYKIRRLTLYDFDLNASLSRKFDL